MPLDRTDSRLLKGLIFFALLGLVFYFFIYRDQTEAVKKSSDDFSKTGEELVKYYDTNDSLKAAYDSADKSLPDAGGSRANIASRQKAYSDANKILQVQLTGKEASSRMSFATWTEIPSDEREPGLYFNRQLSKLREDIKSLCRTNTVGLMDDKIGFKDYPGGTTISSEVARDELRKLFISQTVVSLCVKARTETFEDERKEGKKPSAFMKIRAVNPQKPADTGPVVLKPNPEFNPGVTDPSNPKSKAYLQQRYPKFIKEYPVEIVLQCDYRTFLRFLYKVRDEKAGAFLVIRSLTIVSPHMRDGKDTDGADFLAIAGPNVEKEPDFNWDHIFVKLSAAGMDFPERMEEEEATGTKSGKREPLRMSRKEFEDKNAVK